MMIRSPANKSLLDNVVEELRHTAVAPFPNPPVAFDEPTQTVPSLLHSKRWDRSFSRRAIAVVATISVAMILLFTQWHTATAMAQVQAAIRNAKAISFDMRTLIDGKVFDRRRVLFSPSQGVRAEGSESLHVFNAKSNELLEVNHTDRSALISPVYDSDALHRSVAGAIGRLSSLEPIEQTQVKQLVRDGKQVSEIWSVWDGAAVVVTIDASSNLPISLVIDRGKDSEGRPVREEIDNLQFDADIEIGRFAIRAPESYRVETIVKLEPDEASKQLVLSDKGLGPIVWGMSRDAVIAKIGKPDTVITKPGMEPVVKDGMPVLTPGVGAGIKMAPADPPFETVILHYDSKGFRVFLNSNFGVTSIRCYDARMASLYCRKFEGKSAEGIRIGMTEAQVRERLRGNELPLEHLDFRENRLVTMSSRYESK